ncbi:MAG: hypothetical protein AB7I30_08525 [Isosphaeraceae bacterium]
MSLFPAITPGDGVGAPADLLGTFRDWQAADRRRSPRHDATDSGNEARVWVGWWDGAEFQIQRGSLVNLGRGGARLVLSRRLAPGRTVWVCVGRPDPVDSIEARVLEAGAGPSGHVTRLRFHAPCPAGFLQASGCPTESRSVKGRDTA